MTEKLNCACVIHGDKYDWIYVEKLYAMVRRNLSCDFDFHVFTENSRSVPAHMIKHSLQEWDGVSGPRRSWWYKMQIFDPDKIAGKVLYLDLDVVICDTIDWVQDLDPTNFWTIRDWRYLWRPEWRGINSSVMYWDTRSFADVWRDFASKPVLDIVQKYRGDQDFIGATLPAEKIRFFPAESVVSWRWQIQDGGVEPRKKTHKKPGAGSVLTPGAKILVFHGNPKPHEINDPVIERFWIT